MEAPATPEAVREEVEIESIGSLSKKEETITESSMDNIDPVPKKETASRLQSESPITGTTAREGLGGGASSKSEELQNTLFEKHKIEVNCDEVDNKPVLRISCQVYNDEADIARTLKVLKEIL